MSVRRLAPDELEVAAALLAGGAVVGIPTDTVYGLAAHLADAALEALFAAKRRPDDVPVAVLCADRDDVATLGATFPPVAERLAAALWPGPLTLVLDAPAALVRRVRAVRGVGVRVPDDEVCRSLLALTGPLAVTSANLHGAPPAETADEVVATFAASGVAAVLDGGRRGGVVSTVVSTVGRPEVLREGARLDEVRALLSEG